ncbi:MEDS domain-containing protein [Nocardia sp. AG03]|uniref:MEDS domain-containing protein n=1 Tax=Nocardia sp. AG03 TaxID=3025312 RepID=UPI0024183AD0|nr:MEDS domain-containing protein [Nocardia sp. AG03]
MPIDPSAPALGSSVVRAAGQVTHARQASCHDHACWAYSTRPERDRAAVQWLLEGAGLGQRLLAVTDDADAGARLLAAFAAADTAQAHELTHIPLATVYDVTAPIDTEAQLARYRAEVASALDAGFAGIRVFADITGLTLDPARRPGHTRWEHVADAFMADGNPMAAMCAYDLTATGRDQDAIMAVHPLRHGPSQVPTSFGLYWRDGHRILDGQIDQAGVAALRGALAALPEEATDLDVSDLSFLSARAAAVLAGTDQDQRGRPSVRLVNAHPIVERVWSVMDFDPRMLLSRVGS